MELRAGSSVEPTFDSVVRVTGSQEKGDSERAPVSIEDVARLADVAPITVSRAIRTPAKVSLEKRDRIQKAIQVTGYRPDSIASALRSGRTNIVLGFVSNIFSQQFAIAIRGCAKVLEESGFQFLIGETAYSYKKESAIITDLQQLKPAAVFFSGVIELEENRERLRKLNIPIMETWAYPRDPIDLLVGISNTDGGAMAARHLAERGYRRVAFIGRGGGRGALRYEGFAAECSRLGLKIERKIICKEVHGIEDGRRAFAELRHQMKEIEAVFCANDLIASGVFLAARDEGLRIPGDFALIGFGDNDMAAAVRPGITTIGFDSEALGRHAGNMLLTSLRGEVLDRKMRCMDLSINVRGST
ncbi:LacI family DNA-binding transcriptional regulator [Ochrobactrum sp. CM-21-5]|nr:LacI family DNA-binding transcriptional regulator [Ochrobactrum sp. CM-21-5]MBC2887022.1 LacI family DNA-binding transcriptional regulator [Ochrobactrum sp. CM-21-5]